MAYDVAADGRFLVHVSASGAMAGEASRPHVVVVQQRFDELKARVPAWLARIDQPQIQRPFMTAADSARIH